MRATLDARLNFLRAVSLMTFRRRQLLGWGVLLACAALGAAWLLRLDFSRKISTDVLDLIPVSERDPELAMVRELASEAEARTMLVLLTAADGGAAPPEAARRFATELGRSPAFKQAIALGDPAWRDALGRELFALRFALLFPTWLQEHDDADRPRRIARDLKAFLEKPEALAFQDLIPADPLLLLPGALDRMKDGLSLVQPDATATPAKGLVWAQLAVSPLSEAGQAPAFAAIEQAAVAARTEFPGLRVAYTGVNRFAAASRARIEHEVGWLNTLSLVAVLAVAWLFIRGVHRALHLLPVVAFSVLGAWVATTVVFERVHVIVFVLGALLTGVAIDYGFYLYMQPPASAGEDYWETVRRLAKPLLASCFTTVAGFALLLLSELPMIRQLGVFV
ncbi:MAG TPA: MMPL family transporter, partial [Opitutaceae bacterium]|nr:MMPL family transporter [Opitutaceae bacterium]